MQQQQRQGRQAAAPRLTRTKHSAIGWRALPARVRCPAQPARRPCLSSKVVTLCNHWQGHHPVQPLARSSPCATSSKVITLCNQLFCCNSAPNVLGRTQWAWPHPMGLAAPNGPGRTQSAWPHPMGLAEPKVLGRTQWAWPHLMGLAAPKVLGRTQWAWPHPSTQVPTHPQDTHVCHICATCAPNDTVSRSGQMI